jgi:meso-butanediol dehydrogenase/(S,S)-butanediol dehydrogenase/diacetyl reductase|tara:strand:+ start:791 stop:1552 length:762 start_codon:yes stop_codon:yes gene_type:complete
LGEAILRRFGEEGYRLVVTDVDGAGSSHLAKPDEMASVAESLRSQGTDVLSHGCDVRSAESVKQLFDVVMEHFGRVDVLVNNAGIGFVMKDTREVSPDEWNLVIDVTLSGVFHCTQAAAAHMEAAGHGGRIINIASQAAKSGFPHMAPYCAAKHGVIGLTRTAAIDYGRAGITVNAVCPNHVTTGLGSAQNAYFSAFKGLTEAAYLEEMAARIPLQRIGQAADTAAMCAFLASDDASFITGEAINVSGGEEMH